MAHFSSVLLVTLASYLNLHGRLWPYKQIGSINGQFYNWNGTILHVALPFITGESKTELVKNQYSHHSCFHY